MEEQTEYKFCAETKRRLAFDVQLALRSFENARVSFRATLFCAIALQNKPRANLSSMRTKTHYAVFAFLETSTGLRSS
jgi:hypothetical protein